MKTKCRSSHSYNPIQFPEHSSEQSGFSLFLLKIVGAAITSVYSPSVRDFGPITIYTRVKWFRKNKTKGKFQTQYNQSYHTALKFFFPNNELLKDEESESNQ